ncbi:MAG: glycerate dehydrogenase [Cyclobacteriaceae bacterium]|nr:MAG: glycerate dehydrogenase [Cyclobacteriaceae bacterium]
MNIVVLDGHALNPGDLDWGPLKNLGTVTIYDRTEPYQVITRLKDAAVALTNKSLLSKDQIKHLSKLKFISVMATGYNVVDIGFAKSQNIKVSNVVGYSTASVAQHAMALLMELSNNVGLHAADVGNQGWSRSIDWSYWQKPLIELDGKKLGIIGYGDIGGKMARLARAFGMQILVYHPRLTESTEDFQLVSLDQLFTESDFISLHVPLNPDTEELVNKKRLGQMKPAAFLINTSRGPLIDEKDLRWALDNGIIAGAALDVLSREPPPEDHPLIDAPNCIITPHQAWASYESRRRLMEETVKNVAAFINGTQRNAVV